MPARACSRGSRGWTLLAAAVPGDRAAPSWLGRSRRCPTGSARWTTSPISISISRARWACAMPCWSAPIRRLDRSRDGSAQHAGFRASGAGRAARHQGRRRDRPRHRRHARDAARRVSCAWPGPIPTTGEIDIHALPESELAAIVRGREALALFGWKPYMHNPRLKRWLHRIDIPTLLLWGERDGIVTPDIWRGVARRDSRVAHGDDRRCRAFPALGAAGGVRRARARFIGRTEETSQCAPGISPRWPITRHGKRA